MVRPAGLLSNRYTVDGMPDLSGRVAIVVGGSRGIGEAVVHALVQKECEVHIISATQSHMDEAITHALPLQPRARSLIHTHAIDLGSLSSLLSLAQTLATSLPRLDILYLIAGIGVAPFGLTSDGLGNHFGVNNAAQVLLVDVLYPKLLETATKLQGTEDEGRVRIVSESSELHRAAPSDVKWENLHEVGEGSRDMDETKLYGRSKLGNLQLIAHLSTLLPPSPCIVPISVHPGAVATEQQAGAAQAYPILGRVLEAVAPVVFMSPEQGAESALWAGTDPRIGKQDARAEVYGRYFTEANGKPGTESTQGQDPALAQACWDLCARALKDKIGYDVQLGVKRGRVPHGEA